MGKLTVRTEDALFLLDAAGFLQAAGLRLLKAYYVREGGKTFFAAEFDGGDEGALREAAAALDRKAGELGSAVAGAKGV